MSERPYKRRIYLINKDFQIKFLLYSIFISLITIAIFYFMIVIFYQDARLIGIQSGFPPNHLYFKFIEDSYHDMIWYFIFAAIIVFSFIVFVGIWFSHKIAGPLYRLSAYLRSLNIDKLREPVSFRRKDFFQELAESYNRRLAFLKELANNEPEKLIDALKDKKDKKK